jgi:hypothetical protein
MPRSPEEPVSEEEEFQRRDGAFDGHLCHVQYHAPTLPEFEEPRQRRGAIGGVKVEDILAPASAVHQTGHLFGADETACGYDKVVVIDGPASIESDTVLIRFDQFNIAKDYIHRRRQEVSFGLDHIGRGVDTERYEEETGLVIVVLVLIHNDDAPFL